MSRCSYAILLLSDRISDNYTPKPALIAGLFILGLTHLIDGFTHQKIAFICASCIGRNRGSNHRPLRTLHHLRILHAPSPCSVAQMQ
ncbi:hypothetical protein FRC16_008553 [Serendipita sp. 398]|nr:hypothetical protein FRC16_008553 [Serendipita sp. 398]